jgi:hypothetical protein
MTKKLLLYSAFFAICISCGAHEQADQAAQPAPGENALTESLYTAILNKQVKKLDYARHLSDSLRLENALINGHPVQLTISEFKKHETPDSSEATQWMCGSPFKDAGDEPRITTYWCGNRRYISDGKAVLLEHFELKENELSVPSKNIFFTENTTLNEYRTFFPKSYTYAMQHPPEVNDSLTICRVYFRTGLDDQWIFNFKNGYLSSVTLWWLLC